MFGNLFKISGWRKATPAALAAQNENVPHGPTGEQTDPEKVRALRTGAALAVSLDASPAVLVNIYDYAQRVRGQRRS
jgi:hypothetical protein